MKLYRIVLVIILLINASTVSGQQHVINLKGYPFTLTGNSAGKIIYDEGKQSTEFFWLITPDSALQQTPGGVKYFSCGQVQIFDTTVNNKNLTISFAPISKLKVDFYDKGLPEEKELYSAPSFKVILRTTDNFRHVEILANYRFHDDNTLRRLENTNEILIVFKEKADAHAFVKIFNEVK